MKPLLLISLLLFALPAGAAHNSVNEACRSLCDGEGECVRKCVAQAELFELRPDFILAVSNFTKKIEDRMRALRSGADLGVLAICQGTGWSLDNQMTCLRSYPTPELIKACKRLSSRQEEQVECVRMGKTDAEVDACNGMFPGSDRRLECLGTSVSARDRSTCEERGGDSRMKMECLRSPRSGSGALLRRPSSVRQSD